VARDNDDDPRDVPRVGADQHDVAGLHGHVGARADGDADVGGGQRRGVVHAVAHHGHLLPLRLELAHLGRLVLGQDLGEDGVDAELLGDGVGHGPGVPREHGHLQAPLVQRLDRLSALLPDGVGHREHGQRLAVPEQVDGRLAALRCPVGRRFPARPAIRALLSLEQRRAAHVVLRPPPRPRPSR
jgi:hypothetical protein